MIFNLKKEEDISHFAQRVNWCIKQEKKVDLVVKREVRTPKQNRYLHLIFGWYGLKLGYTIEEVKQTIFKRHVCKDIFEYYKNGIAFYRSTTDLDTLEMTNAIEMFRDHSAKDIPLYLPAPNEKEKLYNIAEHIESYGVRQYL